MKKNNLLYSPEELEAERGLAVIGRFYELVLFYGNTKALRDIVYRSNDKLLIAEYKYFKKKRKEKK